MVRKSTVLLITFILGTLLYAGDRESDSLALISIRNTIRASSGNQAFNSMWKETLSLDRWRNITLTDGRVTAIDILVSDSTITISDDFCELEKLESFSLKAFGGGTITTLTLPSNLGELSSLKKLHLRNCDLTDTPESLRNCDALENIYLGSNALSALPIQDGDWQNIQTVELSGNNFALDELVRIKKIIPATATMHGSDQKSITMTLSSDSTELTFNASGNNEYHWYKTVAKDPASWMNMDITQFTTEEPSIEIDKSEINETIGLLRYECQIRNAVLPEIYTFAKITIIGDEQ